MAYPPPPLSLVADIGGTNTRVALAEGRRLRDGSIRRYRNADFPALDTLLRRFLAQTEGAGITAACVAVAGPVRDGQARMTNLDWSITALSVGSALGLAHPAQDVVILNDLQAQGHALEDVPPARIRRIIAGAADATGATGGARATRLVIGVGTGFNAAAVHKGTWGTMVPASESGHVSLPMHSPADLQLGRYAASGRRHVAVEDVLSGRGLERIYGWLGTTEGDPRTAAAREILDRCINGHEPRAIAAARIFSRMLGTVAGDLALGHLPFGGIYLVGGVARAFAPLLADFGFVEAFHDKGRFADFMSGFALNVIEDDYAALTGAAVHLTALAARG